MKTTLCWDCKNAVPDLYGKRGCAWSRSGKPVEGWDAKPTIHNGLRPYQSYKVKGCPQFELDDVNNVTYRIDELLETTPNGVGRIRLYRIKNKINLSDFARKVYIERRVCSAIENNYRKPTEEQINRIAAFFGVDPNEFIKEEKHEG